jgi:C4-dicarboxylate-specific signal transduction histidine kinase
MSTESTEAALFETRYGNALTVYVQQEMEDALMDAFELGRKALAEGQGLLDLVAIHHTLLASLIEQSSNGADIQRRVARAREFLTQATAPFEMAHRGWHEMVDRLQAANAELERRVETRTKAHRDAMESLYQAQRFASETRAELEHVTNLMARGEMAAAIAHEINQPLAAIATDANAAMNWLALAPPNIEETRSAVQGIIDARKRAGEVIGRIRSMFKQADVQMMLLDANEIIREMVKLARGELIDQQVSVHTELANELPHVLGDRIQLQQVIFNLVTNAIDAMRSSKDRPRVLRIASAMHESESVEVVVEDSGTGIDSKIIDRIFDPFYTTKSHGMGMGLSICRSICGGAPWPSSGIVPSRPRFDVSPCVAEGTAHVPGVSLVDDRRSHGPRDLSDLGHNGECSDE